VSDRLEITAERAAQLIDSLTEIVARAAAVTLAVSFATVERRLKGDQSPVTAADEASEAIIVEGLSRLLPGVPVVAEESVGQKSFDRLEPSFSSVDPLDGTREFLAGRDEFTVNLGIVTNGIPVAGIIAAPARRMLWRGVVGGPAEKLHLQIEDGHAAALDPRAIRTRTGVGKTPVVVATSRSHLDPQTEQFMARLAVGRHYLCGSSVKFCHIAEGEADIYPRLAPTREWDIAAGCAILAAAGGIVTAPGGDALRFGQIAKKFFVPGFIALGDPGLARSISTGEVKI
jgi:3'(2'), 5'-bisphosphate nucleotidase